MSKYFKQCLIFFVVSMIMIGLAGCGGEKDNEQDEQAIDVVNQLLEFTTYEADDERVVFKPIDEDLNWTLHYTIENEFVRFDDFAVALFMEYAIGEGALTNGNLFSYDLDDKHFWISCEVPMEEGTLRTIKYDIEEDVFKLTVWSDNMRSYKEYLASESFEAVLTEMEVAPFMQEDLSVFEEVLADNNLLLDDLLVLNYEQVFNILES